MNNPLPHLSTGTLRALASSLTTGVLSHGNSHSVLGQIVGSNSADVAEYLGYLNTSGFTNIQIAMLIESIIETKSTIPAPENVFELVLSGPEVPGINTCDTAATMRAMIENASKNIMLVGYAVHKARDLFMPIAEKLAALPGFSARLCLDISRTQGDTSLESEIIRRFTKEFREKHWPWQSLPELYYDPRSLETAAVSGHSSLHAKCIIVDHKTALVTSANFTDAAQYRNIEAGIQIKHVPMVRRIEGYFEGLIERGLLKQCIL